LMRNAASTNAKAIETAMKIARKDIGLSVLRGTV
jgi:hypothetical protein